MPKRKPQKPPKPKEFDNRPLQALAGLKKQAEKEAKEAAAAPKPKPAVAKPAPASAPKGALCGAARAAEPAAEPDDDESLFLEAVSGSRPMRGHTPAIPPPPRLPPRKPVAETEEAEVMQTLRELVDGESPLTITETEETIEGMVEGLDPRLLRKLRAGEMSVQDHLDLHGLTREEAHARVEAFLNEAIVQGKRCVLVIHGRGHGSPEHTPVLKNALRNWFTRSGMRKKVLAFCTARPVDGGAGAVYVLLRKFQPRRD